MSSNKHQLSAIIYNKRGRILSIGFNHYAKTHPRQVEYAKKTGNPNKIYLHAEIDALIRLRGRGTAYRIFVARFGKDGSPRCARPCEICARAIKDFGIKIVEYT